MNTQIFEQASDWIVKHREGDLDESQRRAFDAWLRLSPEHVRAYLEVSSIWEDAGSLDPAWNASADELIARARAADNVASLGATRSSEVPDLSAAPHRIEAEVGVRDYSPRILLAASVAILCLGAAVLTWLNRDPRYSTGVGEQRSITLSDGSTIDLNARSRIKIRFSEHERDVDLLEGQALFRVAKDTKRPFIVQSDGTAVRAVGTQFDVYRRANGTVVTVLEGRVAVLGTRRADASPSGENGGSSEPTRRVSPSEGAAPPVLASARGEGAVFVSAGEQLTVTSTARARPIPANVSAATAWTQHRLVFDAASLPEVAEEFNRYNAKQLIVDDPRLASFHVSGVFSSVDPDLLLRFLRAQSEISVTENERDIRISRNEAAPAR
jgi:transmembrane sensor